jgi:hypothetical protein
MEKLDKINDDQQTIVSTGDHKINASALSMD